MCTRSCARLKPNDEHHPDRDPGTTELYVRLELSHPFEVPPMKAAAGSLHKPFGTAPFYFERGKT